MHRMCGWCETVNVGPHTNCSNCGGPLPAPPGSDPGPEPEAAPRRLPPRYTRGLFLNFGVMFGSIWGGVGFFTMVVVCIVSFFAPPAILGACFASLFAISGAVILLWGVQGALASRKILMWGTPSVGQVSAVGQSGSFWVLSYLYEVDGTMLAASLQTSDPIVLKYEKGDALHVVYDPAEPADSSVWPPLKLAF